MTKLLSQAGAATQSGNTTTQPPTSTSQNQTTDQELQNAARELRAAFKNKVTAQVIAARAQEAAQAAQAAVGPTPPPGPRTFTIRGPDGAQTIVGVGDPFSNNDMIPPQVVDISVAFFITVAAIIIGLPLARAFARRMDRRSAPAQIPAEITSQLTQLNQAVDAIALEVERISEGQRYTTRLLTEQREAQLPAGTRR
jgi:ABC-type phosphate/phosphonate transport system permease subunit